MSILTDLILSLELPATMPSHLNASQVSYLCNLASKRLFLFNPSAFIIPQSQQSYYLTESILTLFEANLLQTRTNLLSIDLPIYSKLIPSFSSTSLSHITPISLSAQLQSISLPPSHILLNIILNRVTPHCSLQQFSTFLQYLQTKLQNSSTNQITIEEIDEWKYYPEYSKSLGNVNDLLDLIGVLKMGEFERKILMEKLEGLSLGGSGINATGNNSKDERNVYQQEDEEPNTLPTESSIEQSIDCYYFSQIQKLEEQIQLNQNERKKFILKIKELQQKQEICQNRIKYLMYQNEQILKEIKEAKEEKVRIEQKMEITEFTWLQEKSNIQSKIRSAEAQNVTLKLNITELENFIASLQQKLRSEQEISSLAGSNSKNIFDSLYGYNKKGSIAGEAVTLANEIREILGAEGEGQGEGEKRLRKWSATLDKFNFKKEQLEEEERQDSLQGEIENKEDIKGRVLMFNSMCEEKEISRDAVRDGKMQRTVFKVQFLTKTAVIDGYINLGTDNLIFQDFSHTNLRLTDYCHLTNIQIHHNLLILTISSFDYLVLSFQLPFLSQLLFQKSPISSFCISNDISHKTVVTPQGLVSLTSFPQTILNSNKIFLRNVMWEGKVILIEKRLFGESRRECYGVLKGDGSVMVFEDRVMKQIRKWGMINGAIVKVDQKVDMKWKEGEWGLELEMQEGKVLVRVVENIRKEITEDMERRYESMRKYKQK